jgi:protein tyrosine/serine phosphatase
MLNRPGPYLIHCYAGVDRTGFMAIVLEALMGASLHDIIDDYLKSILDEEFIAPMIARSINVILRQFAKFKPR